MAKIFIQELWQTNLSWDDKLPEELERRWTEFRNDIKELNNTTFSRHIFSKETSSTVQIHTFVHASEKVYGAAVYLRSTSQHRAIQVNLLCAKSRVAPIKRQSLPRLELCVALVGAELTAQIKNDLNSIDTDAILWTDSEIILSSINSSTSTFYTFVANRVARIQKLS